jgi:hypothetical protein
MSFDDKDKSAGWTPPPQAVASDDSSNQWELVFGFSGGGNLEPQFFETKDEALRACLEQLYRADGVDIRVAVETTIELAAVVALSHPLTGGYITLQQKPAIGAINDDFDQGNPGYDLLMKVLNADPATPWDLITFLP